MTSTLFDSGNAGADIEGPYRYRLWRQWDTTGPTCLFVMLNPSTADATKDDNTIACCRRVARREGAARLEVVNLYAWRATKPTDLTLADDPVGPRNDAAIRDAAHYADQIVAAWGAGGGPRAQAVMDILGWAPLYCLARTRGGHPRHPRGVPAVKPLERYP